jgi:hypothetical protein
MQLLFVGSYHMSQQQHMALCGAVPLPWPLLTLSRARVTETAPHVPVVTSGFDGCGVIPVTWCGGLLLSSWGRSAVFNASGRQQ